MAGRASPSAVGIATTEDVVILPVCGGTLKRSASYPHTARCRARTEASTPSDASVKSRESAMTTAPLPSFLPLDALDEFRKFDGPLIYLAAPLGIRIHAYGKTDSRMLTGTANILSESTSSSSRHYPWALHSMRMPYRTAPGTPLDSRCWRAVTSYGF